MASIKQMKKQILALEAQVGHQAALLKKYVKGDEPVNNDERAELYHEIDSLHNYILTNDKVITAYQQWFARNAHWMQRFNNMMKYDPTLGNYNRLGADDPIVIPEVEQWEPVKGVPRLSTVAPVDDEE